MFDLPKDYDVLFYAKCDQNICDTCPMSEGRQLHCLGHKRPEELTLQERKKILKFIKEED